MNNRKIKVLIVDDSAVVRQSLRTILEADSEIQIIGTASDPIIASKKIQMEVPDVITLDIEMPRMDGITFLRKLMSQHPIPVVIISSLTGQGTDLAMRAMQYGAVEVITKPEITGTRSFDEQQIMLCDAIKAAAQVRLLRQSPNNKQETVDSSTTPPVTISMHERRENFTADVIIERSSPLQKIIQTEQIIVLGASTGGTEAIREIVRRLPPQTPGMAIVQHMPEGFTKSFAKSLNLITNLDVKEAEDGDRLYGGRILIAQGNKHLLIKRSGKEYIVEVKEGPLVNRHRPSVDVLFRSAARYAGKNAIGVILTGMGADGSKGLLEMKEAGAYTIAQNQASSIVFGMPREAIELGAAKEIADLYDIPALLVKKTIHN